MTVIPTMEEYERKPADSVDGVIVPMPLAVKQRRPGRRDDHTRSTLPASACGLDQATEDFDEDDLYAAM
jgi:hypothetical protein